MTDPDDPWSDLPTVYTPPVRRRGAPFWLFPATVLVGLGQLLCFVGSGLLVSPSPDLQPLAAICEGGLAILNLCVLPLTIVGLIIGRGRERIAAVMTAGILVLEVSALIYFIANFRFEF